MGDARANAKAGLDWVEGERRPPPGPGRYFACATPGLGIDPLAGDLSSILIKSHHDAHKGLLKLHG